ncbi:Flp family type IVb pilin [Thalassobacillus hwangdonensis]|uniref:Flp family type IVb pilin n=1 Tax=Thalassobacillus hwangdonensis TaxID=546108 RepID=A0ABW3L5B6_9BACI
MRVFDRLWKEEDGQAMTEYGLIIGLVAVVVIGVLATLGTRIQGFFTQIITQLGG